MPASNEMTCRELVELVTDYLEATMPGADRDRFEEHLGQCPPCRAYLDQMRQTIAALGKLPRESISDDAKRGLLDVFRDWKKRSPT
ncbi:MAG TPA: zf-HC2 domain-containing protein [bacterium]|nr:zf-HC2 domain-containing protein [bacterium]